MNLLEQLAAQENFRDVRLSHRGKAAYRAEYDGIELFLRRGKYALYLPLPLSGNALGLVEFLERHNVRTLKEVYLQLDDNFVYEVVNGRRGLEMPISSVRLMVEGILESF